MRRIITVLTIAALMAVMLVAGSGYAFAKAFIPDFGGPAKGQVTQQAAENCDANFVKQADKGVTVGGGPKTGEAGTEESAPTNCDHFFQREGFIGKDTE
jgi:hypothetical protein